MNRAAAVATLSGAVSALALPAAAAEPARAANHPSMAVICDVLGPDTVVVDESAGRRVEGTPIIGWIDVTRRDSTTGNFLSHDRVYEKQPNIAVDEICSFDVAAETITLGFVLDGQVRLTGSDARDAWGS